jgi:ATP-dependent protease HslVU (ClpYQ) peptidase subunit
MTTIAWDGKALAADRCSWSGGARRSVRKVFRITRPDGAPALVAFAGSGDFATKLLDWLRVGGDAPNWRDFVKEDDRDRQCAVLVDSDHRVWQISYQLVWLEYEEPFYAYGAGQEFAWGALEAGASAERAVQIAEKRSDYAGLGVDVVSF